MRHLIIKTICTFIRFAIDFVYERDCTHDDPRTGNYYQVHKKWTKLQ